MENKQDSRAWMSYDTEPMGLNNEFAAENLSWKTF